jgi:hypothetical protein
LDIKHKLLFHNNINNSQMQKNGKFAKDILIN